MIIKFDHITHVIEKQSVKKVLKDYYLQGYQKKFAEIGLENVSSKIPFFKLEHQMHDLYYLECEKEGRVPVEVISYDKVYKKNLMKLENRIIVKLNNITALEELLSIIGAKTTCEEHVFNIKGVFDKSDILFELQQSNKPIVSYLDNGGIGCITLLVNSLDKVKKNIAKTQCICSDIEKIFINNEELCVMFVASPKKEVIFELISK